jgi:hypothetical protein
MRFYGAEHNNIEPHHTHVHVYDIQHIALFDRLYLDPKANPKFLNFKELGNTSTGDKE